MIATLTTIGYGDFSPTMPISKVITIFYALDGAAVLLLLLDRIRSLLEERYVNRSEQERDATTDAYTSQGD